MNGTSIINKLMDYGCKYIIFREYATTGDGQLSGAMLASIIKASGKNASEVASVMNVLPQTLINIKAPNELKAKLDSDKDIIDAIENVKKIARRIATLRLFCDEDDKLTYNISQVNGEILLVSNFTLCDRKNVSGARPDFSLSADNAIAPDATSGAVTLPLKCPPPRKSSKPWYLQFAV